MSPKDKVGITSSVEHNQTALWEQSDLGLHCLLRSFCPNIENFYSTVSSFKDITTVTVPCCKAFNPTALRKAKIVYNFGLSECNRVKDLSF